jgi:vacuolar-type H+-ATPase subunit H
MKKVIVSFILLATVFTMAKAQDKKFDPTVGAQHELDMLQKKLNLSDVQKAQVSTILMDRAQKITDFKAAADAAKESFKQSLLAQGKPDMKEIMDAGNSKISALLNDKQKAAFDMFINNKRDDMVSRLNNKMRH